MDDNGSVLGEQTAAALGAGMGSYHCIWIFIIILVVIYILTLMYDGVRKARELPDYPRHVYRFLFIDILLTIAFLCAILIPVPCIVIALAITTGLSELWSLYLHYKLR